MAKYDAVLFDVDGTLLDSAPGIISTIEESLQQLGVPGPYGDLHRFVGPPLRKTYAEFFTQETQIEEAVRIYRKSYEKRGSHECSIYPGVQEMLTALKEAGVLLYTATAKATEVVAPILKEQGLTDYFDAVMGASMDRSRDTKPEVIRFVLQRPELAGKRVLMVGDRADDLEGASLCGIPSACVLYGYGSRAEAEPFHPVCYAASCGELTDFIIRG